MDRRLPFISLANLFRKSNTVAFGIAAILFLASGASASNFIIYSFQNSNDGVAPRAGLVADRVGNLYGTTFYGGQFGAGTVFQLSPPAVKGGAWTETTLYTFDFRTGTGPSASLILDSAGNLYGTTWLGGTCGGGAIFELTPPAVQGGLWTETASLGCVANDVYTPLAGLVMDVAGNLYGTATSGGAYCTFGGCGGVFELAKPSFPGGAWTETVIYNFNGADFPEGSIGGTRAGLSMDASGALYGTTFAYDGSPFGTVFRLNPPTHRGAHWTHSLLYAFKGSTDGAGSFSGVIFDKNGNLDGATMLGGNGCSYYTGSCGMVFQLTPTPKGPWQKTVLYSFNGAKDGGAPGGDLTISPSGKLYGTAWGGDSKCWSCGEVFRLEPNGGSWKETVLQHFSGGTESEGPVGSVVFGWHGALYGASFSGGDGSCITGCGAVIKISP